MSDTNQLALLPGGGDSTHRMCAIYHRDVISFLRREKIGQCIRYVSRHLNASASSIPACRMPRRELHAVRISIVSGIDERCLR